MFCSRCGKQLQDGVQFCANCGNNITKNVTPEITEKVTVMLDPSEVINHGEDNGKKTTSGHAGTYGLILIMVSIILSLVSMFTIGFEAFIPITMIGTALFVVGFLIRMFCP